MTDAEFVHRFESGHILSSGFHHRDHLRIAWWYLQDLSLDDAIDRVQSAIRTFAARHGHGYKYHATLTELWTRLVAVHAIASPSSTFSDFVDDNAELLDKKLPLRFYSVDRLYSQHARSAWMEPDIAALPKG